MFPLGVTQRIGESERQTLPTRLFNQVLVRPPSDDYPNCHSENPAKNQIDLTLAREQHREYVSTLKESGINVTSLPVLDGFPDSVFLQDPAILGTRNSIICRFGLETRQGEENGLFERLQDLNIDLGNARRIVSPATLEGGDVMVTDHGFFIGADGRSNAEGTRQLRSLLGAASLTVVRARAFHLLSGCSYLGAKTVLVAPSIVGPRTFEGFRKIEVPDDEAYAANTLYLGEGRVLMPIGYPKTRGRLRQSGYIPVELDNSEFWKGDGGISCLSCPMYSVF